MQKADPHPIIAPTPISHARWVMVSSRLRSAVTEKSVHESASNLTNTATSPAKTDLKKRVDADKAVSTIFI